MEGYQNFFYSREKSDGLKTLSPGSDNIRFCHLKVLSSEMDPAEIRLIR
jgi:hypothetical protein